MPTKARKTANLTRGQGIRGIAVAERRVLSAETTGRGKDPSARPPALGFSADVIASIRPSRASDPESLIMPYLAFHHGRPRPLGAK